MLQSIDAKLTSAAMFLVVQLDLEQRNAVTTVRNLLGDLSALVRGVGFRIPDGQLSCVTGIGSDAWSMRTCRVSSEWIGGDGTNSPAVCLWC